MIIIGSTALKYWFPEFRRDPKDLDVVCKKEEILKLELQYSKIEKLENPVLLDYCKNLNNKYLSPNLLYTLKISHAIGWNINWEKHLYDIQFLKKKGCILDKDLFYRLYNFWPTVHGRNKRSDLEMSAEDFFDNAVDSPHDHDYLHTILNPEPTFKKILKDEVAVDEERIINLSFEEKCELVREEVMVMAAERYKGTSFKIRYARMLKKFILNHAPLEVGIFAIENFEHLHQAPFDFMKTINETLKQQNLQILV